MTLLEAETIKRIPNLKNGILLKFESFDFIFY